jgi:SNF2 family DNA or RNA helicase
MYLHRNVSIMFKHLLGHYSIMKLSIDNKQGLSGILGDEMGLGKTLQTLSLIQHLKETDPRVATGRQQRPFLVVCPLSVLSSWMAEARRWTPKLRVSHFDKFQIVHLLTLRTGYPFPWPCSGAG